MKTLLKKYIPINKVRLILERLDLLLARGCSKNKFLVKIYYFLFSNQFDREQVAVLRGRCAHYKGFDSFGARAARLRRNIHRIEKGIIMRPRRHVFADDYIVETVQRLKTCISNNLLLEDEMIWAKDVLSFYFDVVGDSKNINHARNLFKEIIFSGRSSNCSPMIPYKRSMGIKTNLTYDDFYYLCCQRRSVRWFEDKIVPYDLILQAIRAASQAPSACNRQPFQFYIFDKPNEARFVASLAGGTNGFADNFQSLVVIVGDLSAYSYERDRHVIYIDASLAAMQFMLALETLEISSCVINWPDIDHQELRMKKLLDLHDYLRPIMLIAVGYADKEGLIPFSQKKSNNILAVRKELNI